MRKITFLLLFLVLNVVVAQSSWKKLNSESLAFKGEQLLERDTKPEKFDLFNLDLDSFKNELTLKSRGSNKTIDLPDYNGNITKYQIIESSNFTEPVDEKYGLITSYNVVNVNDKTETGKLSIGVDGVHITLYSTKRSTHYIDPYTKNNKTYISYNRSDVKKSNNHFECQVIKDSEEVIESKNLTNRITNDGNLRSFRLALSSTGEYSQFHINRQGLSTASETQQIAAVLSAMNTTMARVNGLFERDLSVRMNIIIVGGNNPLIFLDPNTDNLDNNSPGTLIDQNQTLCDNVIGTSNYDVGHNFSTGGGGLAALGSVCRSRSKGSGITGLTSPTGDSFDVDFVAHEFGHQFGGNHTFNGDAENCSGSNRNDGTAVEPGSGTTIMGYAGICSPQNVQRNSDDYFHAVSIAEMLNRIQTTANCASLTPNGNTAPTADAGTDYVVPKNTPLILRGTGNDVDGNTSLTYCWEQIDNEIVIGAIPPRSSSTSGAQFRSLSPTNSPNRYLPELSTVVTNSTSSEWQVMPSVAREMNFALTVRDNESGGGATARDDMKITVADVNSFSVVVPFVAVSWNGATRQTVSWDKSTTDQAPINCQNVRIRLSVDGGQTFPHVLIDSTPNDGSQEVLIPNTPTTEARIMVEAVDNIFFNVNLTNFTIVDNPTASVEDFKFDNFSLYPNPSKGIFNISFEVLNTEKVNLKVFDFRGRLVENLQYKNVANKFSEELDLEKLNSGVYLLQIQNGVKQTTKKLIIK
ncbi:reprolysin-like metallopeptidase [uncultured Tenacibaculum sp.]|uniref:zinc-dependent metalloprotease n=1 Tax=uncultured Tenacibaculum sp. TaxID=174713 RepID=UPI00260B0114|nr:zinc-dependent metalloprotease family protein [uncultured Tenacibaculum sp.]